MSIRDLHRRGLTWVVSRCRLHILHYPGWRERIRVTTWRSPQQGLAAPREFVMTDADNRTIGLARGVEPAWHRCRRKLVTTGKSR